MRMSPAQYRTLTGKKGRRRNKFNAKPAFRCEPCGSSAVYGGRCVYCGAQQVRRFDSGAEARRYDQLRLLQASGEIADLECQVRFPIEIDGEKVGDYVCDFQYRDAGGKRVVEDVKGSRATDTAISRFKRKAVQAQHKIRVQVVRR